MTQVRFQLPARLENAVTRLRWMVSVVLGILLVLPVRRSHTADQPEVVPEAASREREVQSATGDSATEAPATEPHRSPVSLAVAGGGRWLLTANSTAGTVSLVDLAAGRVVQELACGRSPREVVWLDGYRAVVSLGDDDAIRVLHFRDGRLSAGRLISVGDEPCGLAVLPAASDAAAVGGKPAGEVFVALAGDDQVARVNTVTAAVVERLPTAGIPRRLCLAPNGKWLITCCNVPGQVLVHDVASGRELSRRNIFDDGFNLGRPIVLEDSSAIIVPGQVNRAFPVHEANIEKGWVIDNRLSRFPLPASEYWEQRQINLDPRGAACGDLYAAVLSEDQQWLVATAAGSHELLVVDYQRLNWPVADPGDFLPVEMLEGEKLFRRVELGGRPLDVQFVSPTTVVVCNYFGNSLQVVDVAEAKLLRTIDLGGPETPNLVRRGEMLFHDADRSFDSWFSCSTCHPGGHTTGQRFDTLNDGNHDTHKLVPSLRGVTHTAPWTWHGWQTSLEASIRKSFQQTMSSMIPVTDEDVRAVYAYLETLEAPPAPAVPADSPAARSAARGKLLFAGKAGCTTCHQGRYLTSDRRVEAGLESSRDFYRGFNPPSLRGLRTRRRFLHDGRADSLEEVLQVYHQPHQLAGEKLTPAELADLLCWLRTL